MDDQTTWIGKHSRNWLEGQNWTNGVPRKGTHAFIPQLQGDLYIPTLLSSISIDYTLKIEGTVENEGFLSIKSDGLIQIEGELINNIAGVIQNKGNVTTEGKLINLGTFDNERVLFVNGTFHNEGVLDNENMLIIMGTLLNVGTVDNHSIVCNIGTLENFNSIQHFGEGRMENQESFPMEVIQDFYRWEVLEEAIPVSTL